MASRGEMGINKGERRRVDSKALFDTIEFTSIHVYVAVD
jgi:hypothetical protein